MKENIIAIIIVLAIVFAAGFGIAFLEEWAWDDGQCFECENGIMELWTVNKYYVYRCNNCENVCRYLFEK